MRSVWSKFSTLILLLLSRFYRWGISPFIHTLAGPGFGCRFEPTCGEYARQAVHHHGWFSGSLLTVRRLARCHPFSRHFGMDPVPVAPSGHACTHPKAVLTENHPKG